MWTNERKTTKEYSQDMILKIAAKLSDWEMAGHYLSIPSEKLKAIDRENYSEDQRKVAMLDTWHKREGGGASYWRLANALYQHGRRDLVESLCRAVSSADESSIHSLRALTVSATDDHTPSNIAVKVPKDCRSGMKL